MIVLDNTSLSTMGINAQNTEIGRLELSSVRGVVIILAAKGFHLAKVITLKVNILIAFLRVSVLRCRSVTILCARSVNTKQTWTQRFG